MTELLVVRYGEIALKGKNRSSFEQKLIKNIRTVIKPICEFEIKYTHGRIYVHYDGMYKDQMIEAIINVFGVVSVSEAIYCENELEIIKEKSREEFKRVLAMNPTFKTFKVETKRSNKGFEFKSPEISRIVGGFINQTVDGVSVDVHNPDIVLNIEVREQTYIYCHKIQALGGMPYGTSGRGMLLLSGGIDSPVAGFMVAKRGVELEAVHYHSYPFTSERALEKVLDLARKMCKYIGKIKIHSVNLLEVQRAISDNCPSSEMTILSRRFMMRIAEEIARERNCQCLVTGENIAQVASQTMEGMTVTTAVVDMPILRPLVAFDKLDIIKIAKDIDTFETSILPYEDCCTVFLPKRVVTKPKIDKMEASESLLDVDGLVKRAIEGKEEYFITKED